MILKFPTQIMLEKDIKKITYLKVNLLLIITFISKITIFLNLGFKLKIGKEYYYSL